MHTISLGKPAELAFDCASLKSHQVKCSQAFPDLIKYEGRYFLTFRSAPSHFPSRQARILIFSSTNTKNWELEHVINHRQDVRDPHFLIFNNKLHLFYMSHMKNVFRLGPDKIFRIQKIHGKWTPPVPLALNKTGFWNIRHHNGTVYMSAYTRQNGSKSPGNMHLQFMVSNDLNAWQTVSHSSITHHTLGKFQTSETAFDFDKDGNIFGTIRSGAYPNLNFSTSRADLDNWTFNLDKFKCDGPRLFCHNHQSFLIARRSFFYKLPLEPYPFFHRIRKTIKTIRYSLSKKRTAIYRFDRNSLKIKHIQDLPSHGDTGYASITSISSNQYLLIYYSSDMDSGKDFNWLRGQFGKTKLYAVTLTIHENSQFSG